MSIPALAIGLGIGVLLIHGTVHAQWQYTDAKGMTKVAQYKLNVPSDSRDAAVWIGPTGPGKPGLSEGQREMRARDEAYRRIGESQVWRVGPLRK